MTRITQTARKSTGGKAPRKVTSKATGGEGPEEEEEEEVNSGAPEDGDFSSKSTKTKKSALAGAIALFKDADDNEDGKLSPSGLDDILVALGFFFSQDNIQQIHKLVDADQSGFLDQDEFIRLIPSLLAMDEAFAAVDTDGDAKFNTTELKVALILMGFLFNDAQLLLLHMMADDDSSGFIEKEEFVTLVLFLLRIKLLFGIADRDKSGALELDQFYPLLNLLELPVPQAKASEAFHKLDTAGKGKLQFEEIVAVVMILKYKS